MTRVAFTRAERDAVYHYYGRRDHAGVIHWDPAIGTLLAKMDSALDGQERRVRAARRRRSAERKRQRARWDRMRGRP